MLVVVHVHVHVYRLRCGWPCAYHWLSLMAVVCMCALELYSIIIMTFGKRVMYNDAILPAVLECICVCVYEDVYANECSTSITVDVLSVVCIC